MDKLIDSKEKETQIKEALKYLKENKIKITSKEKKDLLKNGVQSLKGHEITDPKIKKKIIRAFYKSMKEHYASKTDIKKLIYKFYRNYPSSPKEGIAWTKNILPEEDLETYIKQGILVKSKDGNLIGLGPMGLNLISMWNTERLTKWVIALTIIVIILSIITIILKV